MQKLDVTELREKIDLEGLYVDFGILRSALTVASIARDSGVQCSEPTSEGECRGTCPKCGKAKSFALNVNTNRFNCFGKGCDLKGGGAIDFFAKVNEVSAKEASHLLACAYGIQPYSIEPVAEQNGSRSPQVKNRSPKASQDSGEVVTRLEFEELKSRFERLSNIVWVHMLENDQSNDLAEEYDPPLTKHHVMQ